MYAYVPTAVEISFFYLIFQKNVRNRKYLKSYWCINIIRKNIRRETIVCKNVILIRFIFRYFLPKLNQYAI